MSQGLQCGASDFDEAADLLWNTLKHAMSTLVEEKTIISRETSRWYTFYVARIKRKRGKAYSQFIRSNTDYDWNEYATLRNLYSRYLKNIRKNYYNSEIYKHKGDNRELWKVLKSMLRPDEGHVSIVKFAGLIESEDSIICNKFKSFFFQTCFGNKLKH